MKKFTFSAFLVFNFAFSNAQYINLHNFAGTPYGAFPTGSLISDGTFLYGMTSGGGVNNIGTIFKIMPDGSGYVNLFDFAGVTNGSDPYGDLISDTTFLYSMTFRGGTNDKGVIFKIMPDGSGYVKLLDFDSVNGRYPYGSLILDGTFLYGMTSSGGTNDNGTIFKIMPDGSGYMKLLDFDSANGRYPHGSLILDGTFLYGMTSSGGTNDNGTVFKIMPDGSGYVKLLDFDSVNGSFPLGALISDGTFLYGMTSDGGTNGVGTIFKIMPDGSGYLTLLDFAGSTNGSYPYGSSLINVGTFLYGTTWAGGINDMGTIFRIMPDGSGYVKLLDFAGFPLEGSYPEGSLIADGTFLYGMTSLGCTGDTGSRGTVFKFDYSTIGIEGNDAETQLQVYPNPTTGKINIVCEQEQKGVTLEIINMVGQTILSYQNVNISAGENYWVDISSLESGIYIVRLNNYQTRIVKN